MEVPQAVAHPAVVGQAVADLGLPVVDPVVVVLAAPTEEVALAVPVGDHRAVQAAAVGQARYRLQPAAVRQR